MKWDKLIGPAVSTYYRAQLGEIGNCTLFGYIAYNGARWWNCCISPSDDDAMMAHPNRIEVAGAKTLALAKAHVRTALVAHLKRIRIDAGIAAWELKGNP